MNLILVCKRGSTGNIKSCNIHDLLRDLCLRLAEKEKFLNVVQDIPPCFRGRPLVYRESIYQRRVFRALRSASLARSLTLKGGRMPVKFRLLRVLDVVASDPVESIFNLVNLRYISYYPLWRMELPSSLSLLWNLQTLIIKGHWWLLSAPSEIWEMTQLRHLEFDEIDLPDPPSDGQNDFVLQNLQTILGVENFSWTGEACKRILNIKKLHIKYVDFSKECEGTSYYFLQNLGLLHKLESLKCSFRKPPKREDLLRNLTFPNSLHKLSLCGCVLSWEDLTMIGSLTHLEVLKLSKSVRGPEWNPVEGQFLRLKFLKLEICDELRYWNSESFHFPVLEKLVLYGMDRLKEIPSGIGEIPTLRVIHSDYCSESAAISAMQILEEQESLGNDGLQVRLRFSCMWNLDRFLEKVELERFSSSNFQVGF